MCENITKKELKCEGEVKCGSVRVSQVVQKVQQGKIEIDKVK